MLSAEKPMKQSLVEERYSLFTLEIDKAETAFQSVDQIIEHLRRQVEDHPVARFIATFDHFAHTDGLTQGRVDESILAAQNIVFCFGIALPNPQVMAVRPRSIGVVETADAFIVTFMEAPMPVANVAMEHWAHSIRNREAA